MDKKVITIKFKNLPSSSKFIRSSLPPECQSEGKNPMPYYAIYDKLPVQGIEANAFGMGGGYVIPNDELVTPIYIPHSHFN